MSDPAPRQREKASDLVDLAGPPAPTTDDATKPERDGQPRRRSGGGASRNGGQKRKAPVQQQETAVQLGAPEGAAEDTGVDEKKSDGARRRRRRGPRKRSGPKRAAQDRVMLLHGDPRGTQIAVLEDDQIVEHYVARADEKALAGNVYLGRVQNVLPGMEASFVDIGEARNGVLYAGEVGLAGDEGGDEVPRIETVLKSGQPILVQVTKDPMRAKGARLTALISIAGRHLVLVPGAKSLGVSRRLSDAERSRLRDIAQELRPSEHGLIVRTAAEGVPRADLEKDLHRLLEIWTGIETKAATAQAPSLVYSEPALELRVLRDLFNRDVTRCVVDDPELEATLRTYVRATSPDLEARLAPYNGALPIFEEYRVLEQIRKSLDRRVWLPSGGHLVIDRTEAMTVVDVNTGKFVGKSNLEETVFRTNKEAAIEVSRQLRLRDIGGIIVIDFIDMEISENRDEVLRVFKQELERDKTRTHVFDISPLGLVQMTRKNVSAGIVEAFSDPCPACEGRGIVIHDVD